MLIASVLSLGDAEVAVGLWSRTSSDVAGRGLDMGAGGFLSKVELGEGFLPTLESIDKSLSNL